MTEVNICGNCQELFTIKHKREANKFCSRACYFADLKAKGRPEREAPKIEFKCEQCSTPFFFKPGQLRAYQKQWGKDPKYCTRRCAFDGKMLQPEDWHTDCVVCGKLMPLARRPGGTVNRQRRICSSECRKAFKLAEHERLRPSETREIQYNLTKQGYVRMRFPNIGGVKGREVLQHRYVMEQHLGRELRPEETVHHRVKPTTFNDLSNLELFSSRHGPGQRVREQVDWAIRILLDYPDFLDEAGYESLKARAQDGSAVSLNALFDASPPNGHAATPNVSAT